MTDVRIHHYTVAPDDFEEFSSRRSTLIEAMREQHPGLVHTRLIRLLDGTYNDVWCWDTAKHMQEAFASARTMAEVGAAMSLTSSATADNGGVVDER